MHAHTTTVCRSVQQHACKITCTSGVRTQVTGHFTCQAPTEETHQPHTNHSDRRGTRSATQQHPPEVLQGSRFSEKSDVWSFGVLAWELLKAGAPRPSSSPEDRCPAALWEVIEGCWEPEPEARPDFRDIWKSLQRLLRDDEELEVIS